MPTVSVGVRADPTRLTPIDVIEALIVAVATTAFAETMTLPGAGKVGVGRVAVGVTPVTPMFTEAAVMVSLIVAVAAMAVARTVVLPVATTGAGTVAVAVRAVAETVAPTDTEGVPTT